MQLPWEMRNAYRVWSEKLKGRYHLEDLDRDERILKVYVNETGCKGVKWINLAHDKENW
jgi:hypothetical protein